MSGKNKSGASAAGGASAASGASAAGGETTAPTPRIFDVLRERLAAATGLPAATVSNMLARPPKSEMGDYAFPCFQYAKTLKAPPPRAAAALAEKLRADPELAPLLESAAAAGPFLNFRFRPGLLCAEVLELLRARGANYARGDEGAGKTVVVDFSSPNLAKPFHVGHLIGTILGASLCRIFRALGYRVVGINHLGDWGVQCGWQFLAWEEADPEERERQLAEHGLDYLAELYVKINERAKTEPELETKARELFKRLEDGDEEPRRLWAHFREVTLAQLQKSYDRLGVTFDSTDGEGFFEPFLRPLIEDLQQRGLAEESEGALVVRLDDIPGVPKIAQPFILRKSDGATLYATRDLAAVLHRRKTYDFHRCLYVVDTRQSLHFKQLFAVVAKLGHEWWKDCVHVNYGLMKIREGDAVLAMTTRGGRMIPLGELLDRMVSVVRRIVEEKNPELPSEKKDAAAEAVGVGAVLFWVQARRRSADTVFDWQKATDPGGDSGPYLQYAHARCCSILRKAKERGDAGEDAPVPGAPVPGAPDLSLLVEKEETETAHLLAAYPEMVRQAAREYEPSRIAGYLLSLAACWSNFLNKHHVLASPPPLRAARLALVEAVRFVLADGLSLLGVAAPEEM